MNSGSDNLGIEMRGRPTLKALGLCATNPVRV